jgi:UPF0755 protein
MRRLIPIFIVLLIIACAAVYLIVPLIAEKTYGASSPHLGGIQRFQYSSALLWYDGLLTRSVDPYGLEQGFMIDSGETAFSVATRLEDAGLIRDAGAFRDYLVYRGYDTTVQAGEFTISPATNALYIAERLQDATPAQIRFAVLPGWRMEEIAASLPTSGLAITPDEFLSAAQSPRPGFDFLPDGASAEGFLLPGEYNLPREIGADDLVTTLMNNFALALSPDMREGFSRQGLDVFQAVTLASIVQREAVLPEEQPIIASVFLNRLVAGMKLETDPTIQYALGFGDSWGNWWKSPLSWDDLQVDSLYNTYIHPGLPPGPISNPSLSALRAVAYPAQTPYYFFRARCDGSGGHAFAETFEEHLANACP